MSTFQVSISVSFGVTTKLFSITKIISRKSSTWHFLEIFTRIAGNFPLCLEKLLTIKNF